MPTDTPDLVADYEDQKQSAPDLVGEFEQAKSAQPPQPAADSRPDFTQDALSGKLAPASGKPAEPKGEPYIDRAGMEHQTEAVPEAAGWSDPLIHIAAGAEPIATGLSRIKDNSAPPVSPAMPMARSSRGGPAVIPQAPHAPDQVQRDRQTMLGSAEILQGAGQVGTVALPAALVTAPLKAAAGIGAGYLASEGAGKAVHGKVSPEAEQAIRATAFFIPSAIGVASGLKTGSVETPEGKFSAAEALGGRVKAGIAKTPDVYSGRVKVGDTQFEVNIPRGKSPAAPAGPEILPPGTPVPPVDPATAAMVQYEQGAGNIPKPPPPVPPGQQFGNKLSGDQVDHLSQTIAKAPADQQNALIEEAHGNMTKWINDNNGKVFVDGKIQIAKNPAQAETLAAKIINDASSAHDKSQIDLAKANDKAQTAAAKEQEKAAEAPAVQKSEENQGAKPEPVPASEPASQIAKTEPTTQNLTANEGVKDEVAPAQPSASGEKPVIKLPAEGNNMTGEKPAVPDLVAQHEATPDLVAEHEGTQPSTDQRNPENAELRAKFDQMSPEDRTKALVEYHQRERMSKAVNLPNRLAFDEAEGHGKAPVVAMSDADGLKAFNDKYGYEAGSALLKAKAEALKEAGIDSYHDKGDEFLHRGDSTPGDLKARLEQAREILRKKEFTVTDADGKTITLHGVDFSHGTGPDLATAVDALHAHKAEREARGERARGELRGITEKGRSQAADHGGTKEVAKSLPEGIPAKGKAAEVATGKLTLAPKKFQYKLNTNEHGVTNLLSGQKWNPELAGVVSVWHDPADGKTYVVNGHHRVQLAKQSGVKNLLVRHLNVDSASEARASGALQNIAEGRGTAVDAAKFFRERGMTPADLEQHGISMGEATAENGLALSKLDPYIFDKVVSGELAQGRGIAIGKATDSPATQEAILKLITKAEKRGRKMTDGMVSELARFANRAKETTTESGGLFGNSFRTENNALDKAEVSDYIKSQLLKEKRVFGTVSTEGKASVLGQVKGQNIKAGENQKIALEASQAGELYDKLSSSRGPIDDILENAAQRIAKRENPATVKADAYKQARTELRKTLPGGEGPGTGGLQGGTGTGKEVEGAADRQASVKAPTDSAELRRAKSSSDEPSLPGMAPHIEANRESAAATQGEELTKKLTEQPKSVSAKAGEMERNSPLFRDSEASGQTGLFGDKSIKGKPSERGFAAINIPSVITKGAAESVANFLKETSAKTAIARGVDDKLFSLSKQYEADVLRAVQLMKQVGPLSTPEDQEAIYHHLEDSGVPLDPKQEALLDKIVKPLMDQSAEIRAQLNDAGVPMGEEGYVHRVVKGRSSQLERAMRGGTGTGKGNVLSSAASSTKGRIMMGLTAEGVSGRRVVVSIKGDRVTRYDNGKSTDMGPLRSGMTTKFELQDEKLAPLADKIIKLKQQIKDLPENDRAEQISKLNEQIADLAKQREVLDSVKGRVKGQRASYGAEPTFNQRKAITQQTEKLVKERDRIQNTKDNSFMSNAGQEAMRRAQEHLTVAQNQRARLLEQVDPKELEDKLWVDANGKKWKINQATTKEIEKNTNLKYYHNALASSVTDYLQLLRAKRANDALESMKSDPDFNSMAFKSVKGSMPPEGWQSVSLPQFRDYYFEPHMAEVLDRFAKELHPDPPTVLEKIGNFMTASLLLNPVRHIYNIGNHWLVERGVSGTFNPLSWPTSAKAGVKAIKAVVSQNPDFLSALDHGAAMMSHRTDLQELNQKLFETVMGHLEKNPGIAGELASLSGWDKANESDTGALNTASRATGLRMLNNIRKLGQKAMWMSNDIFMLQSAYDKMARTHGLSFDDAMKQTEKHIPNYRIPTRIMNSKGISDFMGSRLASMFGRYHYGVWKSYFEMAKETVGPNSTAKERLKGLDHLIMLGLLTFVGYKLWDAALQKIAGNKDAHMVRSGASAIPYAVSEIMKGNKAPDELVRGTFTPAVLPQAAAEALLFNRDFFSGAPIRKKSDPAKKQALDTAKHFANTLGPVQQAHQAKKSAHPIGSFLLSQVGVNTNHPKKHK